MTVKALCLAFALAGGCCSVASAQVVQVTFSGELTSGYDGFGYFGTPGGNLAGDAFTLVYSYDTSVGQRNTALGTDSLLDGNSTGTITVNNQSLTVGGSPNSDFDLGFGAANYLVAQNSFSSSQDSSATISGAVATGAPADLETSYSTSNGSGGLYSATTYRDPITGFALFQTFTTAAFVDANVTAVGIASGVPEPSTWAMFLLGFGGLGFLAYRRSQKGNASPTLLAA